MHVRIQQQIEIDAPTLGQLLGLARRYEIQGYRMGQIFRRPRRFRCQRFGVTMYYCRPIAVRLKITASKPVPAKETKPWMAAH